MPRGGWITARCLCSAPGDVASEAWAVGITNTKAGVRDIMVSLGRYVYFNFFPVEPRVPGVQPEDAFCSAVISKTFVLRQPSRHVCLHSHSRLSSLCPVPGIWNAWLDMYRA